MEAVASNAGVALLPVAQIADVRGPTALRLEGSDHRLPVWLHASKTLEWSAVAGRCNRGRCKVEYDAGDDRFVCGCTGREYRPDGTALGGGRPLVTYPVDYRDQTILVELRPAR